MSIPNNSTTLVNGSRVLCVQAAFKLEALEVAAVFFSLGGLTCTLAVAANGAVTLTSPAGSHTSAPGFLRSGEWQYLEIRAQMNFSGRVLVRIDGQRVFDLSGIWVTTATDYSTELHGASAGCTWSEVIVMDGAGSRCNDLIGMSARIALLLPAETGTVSVFEGALEGASQPPSAGALHTYIDDPLPGPNDGTATTIEADAAGGVAVFHFDPPQNARSYEAASLIIEGFRTESDDPGFDAAIVSGAVARESNVTAPDVGVPGIARYRMEVDPNGGAPWTYTRLRALQAGTTSEAPPI